MFRLLVLFCFIASFCCCSRKDKFVFEKIDFNKEIKGDTIGRYLPGNVILLKVRDYGYLDEFQNQFLLIKKVNGRDILTYKIAGGDFDVRVLDNNIYIVDENDKSFGWFYIRNNQLLPKLPKIDSVTAVIENNHKSNFVRMDQGIFSIFEKGKVINKLNYGNFLLRSEFDFDALQIGAYKIVDNRLIKISSDSRGFLRQGDGLYYVSYPGYNINKIYNLAKISDLLDSLININKTPKVLPVD